MIKPLPMPINSAYSFYVLAQIRRALLPNNEQNMNRNYVISSKVRYRMKRCYCSVGISKRLILISRIIG